MSGKCDAAMKLRDTETLDKTAQAIWRIAELQKR